MAGHIVIVGSINMDLVVRAPRHPQPGETILGSSFQTFPGGKGANQAVAAARLGGAVMMIGRVGVDAFGDSLLATLQQDGVDTRWVLRSEGVSSGVALITVSDAGQNNIVVVPGANYRLTPEDIRAAESAFEGARVVVMQLEIPLDAAAEAMTLAHRHGAQVLLNPAPVHPRVAELLPHTDCLIPNEHELAQLTHLETVEQAAAQLKAQGLATLIVTLGAQGVLVLYGDRAARLRPYPVQVVDTTAAGDAFVGAFAVALTEGKSTLEAAAWGNAAGALSVTRAGAQPSLPTREEMLAFLAKNPAEVEE